MSCCAFTPSRCHIDLAALRRNFARLGEPGSIMPVVKSDAYGHGLLPVARALDGAGARASPWAPYAKAWLCVRPAGPDHCAADGRHQPRGLASRRRP